jgi:hypothetical protein
MEEDIKKVDSLTHSLTQSLIQSLTIGDW